MRHDLAESARRVRASAESARRRDRASAVGRVELTGRAPAQVRPDARLGASGLRHGDHRVYVDGRFRDAVVDLPRSAASRLAPCLAPLRAGFELASTFRARSFRSTDPRFERER